MNDKITTIIDQQKCTGCGLCLEVCPDQTISLEEGKAVVSGSNCLQCGHCAAVCPTEAIEVKAIDLANLKYNNFGPVDKWLAWGKFDTAELVRLMASRRSCRNYQDREISRDTLNDLVKIGITAPSGTNCQKWTFTVLDRRDQVKKLGSRIALFFHKLNRMSENPLLRLMSRLFGGNTLGTYYHSYYESVKRGLIEWEEEERDLLFHGAPAVILVGSEPGASCPAEDALLATQNILLGAHSMGLGSCPIGFAVSAIQSEPAIKDIIDIPREEKIYSVIALGYPNENYQRFTGRLTPVVRFPEMS
ncbi:MAG: nitroreductase family protein [Thermodesulfobacteriota bacterium]